MTPQEALAAALVGSGLIARYRQYAHEAHPGTMRPDMGSELSDGWAGHVYEALTEQGYSIVSTEEMEGLRAVVKEARLVAQWHRSIGSGPIHVLDAELGDLGEHARAALEGAKP